MASLLRPSPLSKSPTASESSTTSGKRKISSYFEGIPKRMKDNNHQPSEMETDDTADTAEAKAQEIDKLIEAAGDPSRAMMMMMQRNHSEMSKKMDRFQAGMDQRFDEVNARVGTIEAEVVKTNSDLTSIQQRMNELEQDKLEAHMTINGADASEVDANKSDMISYAVSLIQSFKIKAEASEVDRAYAFPVGSTQRRIIVVFKSAATKQRVMNDKRASSDERKIFFDNRTTAFFGEILRQLRVFVKSNGGRATFYGGRVFYQRDSGPKIRIDSTSEINEKLLQ
jgi:enamine deaminase RidA (YjgF/YER057c/UK114 family)